jgi:hypothetical protein
MSTEIIQGMISFIASLGKITYILLISFYSIPCYHFAFYAIFLGLLWVFTNKQLRPFAILCLICTTLFGLILFFSQLIV